jgi:hypothetical protein
VTSPGYERAADAGPVDGQAANDGLEQCDWDDPMTRLLLLLELADRPAWLQDVARSAPHGTAASRRAG